MKKRIVSLLLAAVTMLALCTSIEGLIQILESIRQAYDTCEDQVRGVVDALRI